VRAPRILTGKQIVGKNRYNKSVDWYALGVLIYEMLAGVPPYHQPTQPANPIRLYEDIMRGPGALKMPGFPPGAVDLILKLMEAEPSRRFGNLKHGAGDVFTHAWFKEVDWAKLLDRQITAPYLPKIQGEGDASACVRALARHARSADARPAAGSRSTRRTRPPRRSTASPARIHTARCSPASTTALEHALASPPRRHSSRVPPARTWARAPTIRIPPAKTRAASPLDPRFLVLSASLLCHLVSCVCVCRPRMCVVLRSTIYWFRASPAGAW
jgi:serine/threonine protein kinase